MSYLNRTQDPRSRATAIVTAGAVHAVLAVGLVTGLAVEFREIIEKKLIGTTVVLLPPEPTPTPSTPVEIAYVPPAPSPPVDLSQTPGPERVEIDESEPIVSFIREIPRVVVTPGPAPAPSPAFAATRAVPRNPASWIDDRDYPRRALIDNVEGSVGYRLVIGTDGRVSSCELTRPSGNRALDDATCRLVSNRARFDPATDETGVRVLGTYTGAVTWEIPD